MTPEKLSIYFDTSPAVRLLQADSAPFIVCFLYERFKRAHVIALPHSELLPALVAYQEKLQEGGFTALRDKPDEYLRDWSSADKRWLQRFLEAAALSPMYQLTPHSETVIEFVERALQQDLAFVGTESRLRLVMQTLEDLLIGSSNDPEVRLKHLREAQGRIAAEIEDIEQNGRVKTFAPTRVREQFALAVRMLKQLQGDFRAVEEKFKEITRQVQQWQLRGIDSRGGILGDALGAEDELKKQDQGVTFFEFLKFIQSPAQQDRLQAMIQQLLQVRELADQAEGLSTIRHMVRGLLDEAEKVLQTTRRLSASLRRLLDTRSQLERRRATELLRQIKVLAAAMSADPPRHIGCDIDDAIEISAPLARTNWSPATRFDQLDLTEYVPDEKLRHELFRQFQQLQPIDWIAMRRRVRQAVEARGSCTLGELLHDEPPGGLVDVLGYLQIACADGHMVRDDATEAVVLPDGPGHVEVTLPLVTFIAGRKLMPGEREFHLAEFDESSIAAVHLLQGVVYQDEGRVWDLVLSHQTRLDGYFNRIGLRLVIDEAEGFAFLRQLEEGELEHLRGYEQLPKLFRKKRLSYDATLACVLLRAELRRFEDEEVDNARCVIATNELFEQWRPFFPETHDDVKLKKALTAALATLEDLKFIREFTKEPQEWEIRRILKARLPVAELERLWTDLKAASDARAPRSSPGDSHE